MRCFACDRLICPGTNITFENVATGMNVAFCTHHCKSRFVTLLREVQQEEVAR